MNNENQKLSRNRKIRNGRRMKIDAKTKSMLKKVIQENRIKIKKFR